MKRTTYDQKRTNKSTAMKTTATTKTTQNKLKSSDLYCSTKRFPDSRMPFIGGTQRERGERRLSTFRLKRKIENHCRSNKFIVVLTKVHYFSTVRYNKCNNNNKSEQGDNIRNYQRNE